MTAIEEMTQVEQLPEGARSVSRAASRPDRDALYGLVLIGGIVLGEVAWLCIIAYAVDWLLS